MIITSGFFSFDYPTYDQDQNLIVAARVYEVTTGTPVLVATVPMPYLYGGTYVGQFTAQSAKSYLVIAAVFLDMAFTTPDPMRGPNVNCYECDMPTTQQVNLNYGSFDLDPTLNLAVNVFSLNSPLTFITQVPMVYVELGAYFAQYNASIGEYYEFITLAYTDDTYTIPDVNLSPGSLCTQAYKTNVVISNFGQPILYAQNDVLPSCDNGIYFSQGDNNITLNLIAASAEGSPVDLTGASLTSLMIGPAGTFVSIPNSQHTVNPDQLNYKGYYTITLLAANTAATMYGQNKDLTTQSTQGTVTVSYQGKGILTVYPNVPEF